MAIKNEVKSSCSEIRQHTFDNGTKIITVCKEGNTSQKENLLCCGARKLSLLFSRDADSDNVLAVLYAFLEKNLSEVEFSKVKDCAEEFALKLLAKKKKQPSY